VGCGLLAEAARGRQFQEVDIFTSVARFCLRHRRRVLAAWVVLFVAGIVIRPGHQAAHDGAQDVVGAEDGESRLARQGKRPRLFRPAWLIPGCLPGWHKDLARRQDDQQSERC
jgi:hypothetical protein